MADRLIDFLGEYRDRMIPFHMPGHKRKQNDYLSVLGGAYDITELPDSDDLHAPEGILLRSMEYAQNVFGGKEFLWMTDGSTCGILAAVYAVCPRGSTVIVARNCHLSVYNALELCDLKPVFVQPAADEIHGFCSSVPPEEAEQAFARHPDACALILTSPTYEGVVSDLRSLGEISRRYGAAMVVDAAHGAHFGFHRAFPDSAAALGADIVIMSLHKTLPALTGGAAAIINNDQFSKPFHRALDIFETSSPSYPVMASCDACAHLLHDRGEALFEAYWNNLTQLRHDVRDLKTIRLLRQEDIADAFDFDPGKLLIQSDSFTGRELYEKLRSRGIEPEMAGFHHVLAMTSVLDEAKDFRALAGALRELDSLEGPQRQTPRIPMPLPKVVCSAYTASHGARRAIPIAEAEGAVCGEYVYAYPPGVPALIPGERIPAGFCDYYHASGNAQIRLRFSETGDNNRISVCEA